jgi:hypothetical protein
MSLSAPCASFFRIAASNGLQLYPMPDERSLLSGTSWRVVVDTRQTCLVDRAAR